MGWPCFLLMAGPRDAGGPLWHQNVVDHRQLYFGVTVKDPLRLHRPLVHRSGRPPRSRARNSTNAAATTAEIANRCSAAYARTRLASPSGSFTVKATARSGISTRPSPAAST